MSNNLAVIEEGMRSLRPTFESVAVDRGMSFDREIEFAMQVLSTNEFSLKVAMDAPQSLYDAITNVAAIGISLNPAKKQAYLVPRKKRICLDISYMGLVDMAVSSGSIRWAQAELVHRADKFRLNGYDRAPTHEFDPFDEQRGEIIGAYTVAKTADGDFLTTVMPIGDIFNIRNRSESYKAGGKSPWNTDEGEMVKKTVTKRGSKMWPKTPRLDAAVHYLNTEGGEGLEPIVDDQPEAVVGKPAVSMPQARAASPDVTDVEAKAPRTADVQAKGQAPEQKAVSRPAAEPSDDGVRMMATVGEINYIKGRLVKKGMSAAQAREMANLEPGDTLDGISKDEFLALRDATK